MREDRWLPPYRGPLEEPGADDGAIITDDLILMWGTGGTKVFTLCCGLIWVFAAIEHWDVESVELNVSKHRGHACSPGVHQSGVDERLYGSVAAEVAQGLLQRVDYGNQNLSDHFVGKARFWGIKPCFAFVEQPQTNRNVKRFNRTLKE